MAIIVRNPDLEERLARIAVSQPIPSTKTELLEQVGILAVAAVDATGDPQAWRGIWPVVAPPPGTDPTDLTNLLMPSRPHT
jgi:hypothetical protein